MCIRDRGSAQQLAAACEKPPMQAKSMLEWILPAVALHPDGSALRDVYKRQVREDEPQQAEEDFSSQKLKGYYTEHGMEDRALSTQSASRLLTDEQMAQVLSDSLATTASLFETLSQGDVYKRQEVSVPFLSFYLIKGISQMRS